MSIVPSFAQLSHTTARTINFVDQSDFKDSNLPYAELLDKAAHSMKDDFPFTDEDVVAFAEYVTRSIPRLTFKNPYALLLAWWFLRNKQEMPSGKEILLKYDKSSREVTRMDVKKYMLLFDESIDI